MENSNKLKKSFVDNLLKKVSIIIDSLLVNNEIEFVYTLNQRIEMLYKILVGKKIYIRFNENECEEEISKISDILKFKIIVNDENDKIMERITELFPDLYILHHFSVLISYYNENTDIQSFLNKKALESFFTVMNGIYSKFKKQI